MAIMSRVVPFAAGLLFAIGLGIAEMTQPSKIIGFLDVFGAWDPSLLLVMAGAIAVYMPAFWLARGMLAPRLHLPGRKDVDVRLVAGAAMFGVGWGLAGYCPGPALVSLTTLTGPALAFGAAMLAGIRLHAALERRSPG
jgi:uncharacterized membrane protein YedE/YeeE